MGSTLEAAYTLSETLIQEAFEHVQRFFKNSSWLRDNRRLGPQRDCVYWTVQGKNFLSCEEVDQVVLRMKEEGWPHVSWTPVNNISTNWELRLSIPQNSPAPEMKG